MLPLPLTDFARVTSAESAKNKALGRVTFFFFHCITFLQKTQVFAKNTRKKITVMRILILIKSKGEAK